MNCSRLSQERGIQLHSRQLLKLGIWSAMLELLVQLAFEQHMNVPEMKPLCQSLLCLTAHPISVIDGELFMFMFKFKEKKMVEYYIYIINNS